MNKLIIPAVLIITSAILVAFSAQGPGQDSTGARPEETRSEKPSPVYVGARKCKVCHLDIHMSWEKTSHARALAALENEQLRDPGCLVCHTTGFGEGGYGDEGGLTDLGGVQCEACHGPGSLYSRSSVMRSPELRAEMGLVRVDSTTCVACHNGESPTFKGFAYQAGLSTGSHSRKRNIPD